MKFNETYRKDNMADAVLHTIFVHNNRFRANKGCLRLVGPFKSSTVRRGPLIPQIRFGPSNKLRECGKYSMSCKLILLLNTFNYSIVI